jgi:hypothetical protein
MGIVNFGIPEQETKWLKEKMNLTTVVEGGTYQGGTAKKLSREFEKIITIEKSDVMFEKAKKNIGCIQNIIQLRGDTREHLPKLASENNDVLFWLDAHWSGGDTYGEKDECPLLQELEIIFNSAIRNYAILIDDARLILAPPPLPHKVKNWPTIKQVADIIPLNFDMIVHEDVIYLVPNEIGIPGYIQCKTTASWHKYAEISRPSLKNQIVDKLLSIAATFKVK